MTTGAGKSRKWLGYTVYAVLVTVVLLYYLFPAEVFEEVVDNGIRRINQELVFEAGRVKPWIPGGLRITAGSIHLKTVEQPLFQADTLFIGPELLKFIMGEFSFNLRGKAYGGDIKGEFFSSGTETDAIAGDLVFTNFQLSEYGFLTERFKHRLTGRLSGEVTIDRGAAGKTDGASLEMNLNDGLLQFQEPLLNIAAVDLQNIRLEAQLGRSEVRITKAELTGPEFNGTMTGSIQLHRDISRSPISLKGTLEPQAPFYQKYPEIRELLKTMKKRVRRGQYFFAVSGTLGDPHFELL